MRGDGVNESKVAALASFLNIGQYDIEPVGVTEAQYAVEDSRFLVLTEDEADELAKDMLTAQLEEYIDKVKDFDTFSSRVIEDNGRAVYLSADGEENEEDGYLIYRMN